MDMPPYDFASAVQEDRVRAGYWVRTEDAEHRILDFTANGFVIAADTPPPMRGFAEILLGRERVRHGLIVCCWSEDGRVGYEFKHHTQAQPVQADHAPGVVTGYSDL
ncbi:MAG: hypothetical protein AAF674_17855 [Pseudomonadota bacterium]